MSDTRVSFGTKSTSKDGVAVEGLTLDGDLERKSGLAIAKADQGTR